MSDDDELARCYAKLGQLHAPGALDSAAAGRLYCECRTVTEWHRRSARLACKPCPACGSPLWLPAGCHGEAHHTVIAMIITLPERPLMALN